jgi:hypothetical protein
MKKFFSAFRYFLLRLTCSALLIVTLSITGFCQAETLNPNTFWRLNGNSGINSGSNFIGTINNASLRFKTNDTHRMMIDSTGNVGIGVALPTQRLHVQGAINFSGPIMPAGNPGNTNQFLLSSGAGAPPQWSNFSIDNATAIQLIGKYYSVLEFTTVWNNGTRRVFAIADPDCLEGSQISVSITVDEPLLNGMEISNVQTSNGYFKISIVNRTGLNFSSGTIPIAYTAFY